MQTPPLNVDKRYAQCAQATTASAEVYYLMQCLADDGQSDTVELIVLILRTVQAVGVAETLHPAALPRLRLN